MNKSLLILILCVPSFISMFIRCLLLFFSDSQCFWNTRFDRRKWAMQCTFTIIITIISISKEWLFRIWSTVLHIQLYDSIISSSHSIQLTYVWFYFLRLKKKNNPADHLPLSRKQWQLKNYSFFYFTLVWQIACILFWQRISVDEFNFSAISDVILYFSLWISSTQLRQRMTTANVYSQQNCV